MARIAGVIRSSVSIVVPGAVVATVVAWACAVWAPARRVVPPVRDQWSDTASLRGPGYAGTAVLAARGFEDGPHEWARTGASTFRSGWPLKMYRSRVVPRSSLAAFQLPVAELLRRGYPTNRLPGWLRARADRRIPVQPLWTGFTANVAAWSLLLLGLRRAWRSGVRAARRRRGRCGMCGYPRAGLPPDAPAACPECGHGDRTHGRTA